MSDGVKDYSSVPEGGNSHYNGVTSMHGKNTTEQYRQIPKYSEPGKAGGGLEGAHRNTQKGP